MRIPFRTLPLFCRIALTAALCLGAATHARAARLDVTLVPNASGTGATLDPGSGTFLIDDSRLEADARVSFADIVVDIEIGGFRFDRSLQPDDEAVIFGPEGREIVAVEDASNGTFINLTDASRSANLLIQEGIRFTSGTLADAFAFNLILPIGPQTAPNVQFTGRVEFTPALAVVPLPPSLYSFGAVIAVLAFWNAARRRSLRHVGLLAGGSGVTAAGAGAAPRLHPA